MGERSNALLYAFNGMTLDWNSVLGAGFVDAPRDFISVFRACSLEELMGITREGLSAPSPETRHPDIRKEMELLDRYRPSKIIDRGVSRLGAIYATPTPATPRLPSRKDHYVLEMKVDPRDGYVGDMDFITCLIPFLRTQRKGLDRYHGAFAKYWESIIPLQKFFQYYRRVETTDGDHWLLKNRAPSHLPKTFFAPEILMMTPVISQRHIRLFQKDALPEIVHEHEDEIVSAWGEE